MAGILFVCWPGEGPGETGLFPEAMAHGLFPNAPRLFHRRKHENPFHGWIESVPRSG
jgi:hypothetical protein